MLYNGKLADLENLRLLRCRDSSKMAAPGLSFMPGMIKKDKPAVELYAVKMPGDYRPVTIAMIKEISAKESADGNGYDIIIAFKEEYKRLWADMVMKNQGRALAVTSDNMVLVCPVVHAPIEDGAATISHMMQDKAAIDEIVKRIKFSLPLEVVIGREEMIGELNTPERATDKEPE